MGTTDCGAPDREWILRRHINIPHAEWNPIEFGQTDYPLTEALTGIYDVMGRWFDDPSAYTWTHTRVALHVDTSGLMATALTGGQRQHVMIGEPKDDVLAMSTGVFI